MWSGVQPVYSAASLTEIQSDRVASLSASQSSCRIFEPALYHHLTDQANRLADCLKVLISRWEFTWAGCWACDFMTLTYNVGTSRSSFASDCFFPDR